MSNSRFILLSAIISVLFLIYIMALPNWGQLQKALDDPETIEEAIARLIAVHEEAPTSHLGDGESLENHKTAEVIDHPERSIPTDKYSTSEVLVSFHPNNTEAWVTENVSLTPTLAGIFLRNSSTDDSQSLLAGSIFEVPSDLTPYSFFILDFQFGFRRVNRADPILIGFGVSEDPGDSILFNFEDENVNGRIILDDVTTNTANLDIDYESDDYFHAHARAIYDLNDETITFYLNDDVIGTISPSSQLSIAPTFLTYLTRSASVDRRVTMTLFSGFASLGTY